MNRRVFLLVLLAIPASGITLSSFISPPPSKIAPPKITTTEPKQVTYRPKQKGDVLGASTVNHPASTVVSSPRPSVPTLVVASPAPVQTVTMEPAPAPAIDTQPNRDLLLESGFSYDPARDLASVDDVLNAIKGGPNLPTTDSGILIDTPVVTADPVATVPANGSSGVDDPNATP